MLILPVMLLSFFATFFMVIKSPVTAISKRQREFDREVLFAGRFILVKLHSGKPLFNAFIDASKSYGVASGYFKEIVDDINMGTPIEKALEKAMIYSPSEKFKKILFQMTNSLKVGIDVSDSLSSVLDEISNEQMLEIQRYSKKLNSLSLFYMLAAIVIPSLGTAILAVVGSLMGFLRDNSSASKIFFVVCIVIFVIQFFFIAIFKTTRLSVNL